MAENIKLDIKRFFLCHRNIRENEGKLPRLIHMSHQLWRFDFFVVESDSFVHNLSEYGLNEIWTYARLVCPAHMLFLSYAVLVKMSNVWSFHVDCMHGGNHIIVFFSSMIVLAMCKQHNSNR